MEYFEVAAKWWVDQIRKSELSKFHNNEIAPNSGTIMLYEATTRQSIHPTEEDFTKFYDLLSNYIKDVVEESGTLILVSDYGPEESLCAIAAQSNIPLARFPWKVRMYISSKEVILYQGTGARGQVLYPE